MTKTVFEIVIDVWKLPPPPINLPPAYRHVRAKEETCIEGDKREAEYVEYMFTPQSDEYQDKWLDHLAICSFCRKREYRNVTAR